MSGVLLSHRFQSGTSCILLTFSLTHISTASLAHGTDCKHSCCTTSAAALRRWRRSGDSTLQHPTPLPYQPYFVVFVPEFSGCRLLRLLAQRSEGDGGAPKQLPQTLRRNQRPALQSNTHLLVSLRLRDPRALRVLLHRPLPLHLQHRQLCRRPASLSRALVAAHACKGDLLLLRRGFRRLLKILTL